MKKNDKVPFGLARDIEDLDRKLFSLLKQRGALLKKAGTPGPGGSVNLGHAFEKSLWNQWQKMAGGAFGDVSVLRKFFFQLQELIPTGRAGEGSGDAEKTFVLNPFIKPVDVDVEGASCSRHSRLWAVLAALSGRPAHMRAPLIHDPLVDLIKGLNRGGSGLHWDDEGLHNRGGELSFHDTLVHVGDDFLNLALIAPLALGEPCAVRFAGGSRLKLADLRDYADLLSRMGSRTVNLTPDSRGLPLRMEASGQTPDEISLGGLPCEAAMGLALAAPGYARGLAIRWDAEERPGVGDALVPVREMLVLCGIAVESGPGLLRVSPGEIRLPEDYKPPLDPFLAAAMLSLPAFAGGKVRLKGKWPQELPEHATALAMLEAAGCAVEARKREVQSRKPGASAKRDAPRVGESASSRWLPLGLVLACAAARDVDKGASIPAPQGEDAEVAEDFLSRLPYALRQGEEQWTITRADKTRSQDPLSCPDGRWAVAAALASFLRPGLELRNPAVVTELMPGFWNFYNGLPSPHDAKPREQEPENVQQRRRYKI